MLDKPCKIVALRVLNVGAAATANDNNTAPAYTASRAGRAFLPALRVTRMPAFFHFLFAFALQLAVK